MNLVLQCITKKYVDFSTRASRKEFWLFVLFYIVAYSILMTIDFSMGWATLETGYGILTGIFALATLLPYLAVGVRRLHDTNRVGWWLFIGLIPLVGIIWLIVLWCLKSDEGENRFG
jgi:uncharacterized membrane protein YhaH (DUF805 family)|tara:strand:- start:257 stop:607 length:351 start_codon:yes stop_codon:yes gene_type:complete